MKYEVEIEGLRKIADRLNEEIVEKIAKWVETTVRFVAVQRRFGQFDVDAFREDFYDQIRRVVMRSSLDAEGVERVFREIVNIHIKAESEVHHEGCFGKDPSSCYTTL